MKNDRLFNSLSTRSGSDCCQQDSEILNFLDENTIDGVEAGQTYLGQMIAHDIVPSTSFKKKRENVSPALNLDSIYGEYPGKYLKNGRFEFGSAYFSNGEASPDFKDLKRDGDCKAMIPEPRNDENIIISQLHLFWQEFHNFIHDDDELQDSNDRFETARLIVTKVFHEVVTNDYLWQILHPTVYSLYFGNSSKFTFFYKDYNKLLKKGIPIEFSHAVFRFGHSMIRKDYLLNESHFINSKNMLNDRKPKYLPVDSVINWKAFFQLKNIYASPSFHSRRKNNKKANNSDISVASANDIDTNFVKAMEHVPFINGTCEDIITININAGDKIQSPNGNSVKNELLNINNSSEIDGILKADFYKDNKLKQLSLWPYILKEAELNREDNKTHHLGAVGSIIIADVLKASMQSTNLDLNTNQLITYEKIVKKIKDNQYSRYTTNKHRKNKKCFLKKPPTMGYCINYLN